MTQALDAAIRAGCDAKRCNYPACLSSLAGMECRTHKRQSTKTLRAALPAEPPEWWDDVYTRMPADDAWCALRAHLLGEDA